MQSVFPALILCQPQTGALKVAALTLLDRLVVACHRAGCPSIQIVCAGPLPSLQRARALNIPMEVTATTPVLAGPTLVAECCLIVQADDVKAVMARQGRLLDANGGPLPMGVVRNPEDLDRALNLLPPISAEGIAACVPDIATAQCVESALWNSLTTSSDGVVDRFFNRPLGRFLSKPLIYTPVTPNQVTVVSMLAGIAGAYYFALGNYTAGIIGALLLQLSALIDCVDGDIARIAFKESALGKWLDIALDQVVHMAVFAGIAIGLSRQGSEAPVLWLGISAVVGALISFPVVVRGRWLANKRTDALLERFIDAASTRDFTVLVLLLAVIGKLHWFLWLTGVTVHVFWITALCLQLSKSSKVRSAT